MNDFRDRDLRLSGFSRADPDDDGLEVLGPDECLCLLASKRVGRVGLTVGALPTVLAVNFRLIDDRIYFWSSSGEKVTAATTFAVVAFEVDDIDPVEPVGWSVVVTGVAQPVEPFEEGARVERIGVAQWAPAPRSHLVSISIDLVTGWRSGPASIVAHPMG